MKSVDESQTCPWAACSTFFSSKLVKSSYQDSVLHLSSSSFPPHSGIKEMIKSEEVLEKSSLFSG